jgi:hypothetical protein
MLPAIYVKIYHFSYRESAATRDRNKHQENSRGKFHVDRPGSFARITPKEPLQLNSENPYKSLPFSEIQILPAI